MNFEMFVDGQSLVKFDVNVATLQNVLAAAVKKGDTDESTSTPASVEQMKALLSRIDQRSVVFLKAIATSQDGSVTWNQMRDLFSIKKKDDWVAYSGSFGKGITRAYRNILGDRAARLIAWNEADWTEHDWESDMCNVYIDGPALAALREAVAA